MPALVVLVTANELLELRVAGASSHLVEDSCFVAFLGGDHEAEDEGAPLVVRDERAKEPAPELHFEVHEVLPFAWAFSS